MSAEILLKNFIDSHFGVSSSDDVTRWMPHPPRDATGESERAGRVDTPCQDGTALDTFQD